MVRTRGCVAKASFGQKTLLKSAKLHEPEVVKIRRKESSYATTPKISVMSG